MGTPGTLTGLLQYGRARGSDVDVGIFPEHFSVREVKLAYLENKSAFVKGRGSASEEPVKMRKRAKLVGFSHLTNSKTFENWRNAKTVRERRAVVPAKKIALLGFGENKARHASRISKR